LARVLVLSVLLMVLELESMGVGDYQEYRFYPILVKLGY